MPQKYQEIRTLEQTRPPPLGNIADLAFVTCSWAQRASRASSCRGTAQLLCTTSMTSRGGQGRAPEQDQLGTVRLVSRGCSWKAVPLTTLYSGPLAKDQPEASFCTHSVNRLYMASRNGPPDPAPVFHIQNIPLGTAMKALAKCFSGRRFLWRTLPSQCGLYLPSGAEAFPGAVVTGGCLAGHTPE